MSKRPPLDEVLALFRATVATEGVTTGAGAVTGDSIIDAGLIGAGATSFESMLMVVYPGQPRAVDSMDITAFNNATGEVTLARAYKGVAAAIPAGVPYQIVTFRFVPAEVAALQADVGDASASTLGSLYAILGDPAQSFLAMIGYEGAISLANKLTAARAGYLDNLHGTPTTGTFSLVNNVNEQDCIVFAAAQQEVWLSLDMSNLTQNNTVREYEEVDGANPRQISAKVFPTDFDTGTELVSIHFVQKNADYKVTLQAAVLEGAARDVPYRYLARSLN